MLKQEPDKYPDLADNDPHHNELTEFNITSTQRFPASPPPFLSQLKGRIHKALDHNATTILMTTVTVYALFADDIRYGAFSKSADEVFFSLAAICLAFFFAELALSFWVKPDYRWSFYLFLDAIATISLVPDIGWIWYPMVGIEEDQGGDSNTKQIQSAGKASRAGTRTSRVIRIIRLVRLIRIVKLYKSAKQALKKKEDPADSIPAESRVGKKLGDLTTKRVIVLVLLMLTILPLFENEFYVENQSSWDYGLNELAAFFNRPGFNQLYEEYIDYHKDDSRPLIFISYERDGKTVKWDRDPKPDDLRFDEKHYSYETELVAVFDLRIDTRLGAYLNICKTVFLCIVMTLGALYFTADASRLVIQPIEKMLDRVKRIANNPISQKKTAHIYDVAQKQPKWYRCKEKPVEEAEYETSIIENTINKIGVLLAIGFGEAGAAIIGKNMQHGGDIDPMLEGNKVVGIFGFCDIRNFTDTTEELLGGVMVFVNEIAQIVHRIVNKYQGAANKNIGDAFLLVWKFNEKDYYVQDQQIVRGSGSKKARYVPDLALMAFLKVLAKINRDPSIMEYRKNAKLLSRIPNYQVKMGFGLHIGWGIEGAIGSEFKIDASYLSPHVNIASRLEAATKQYGVPILVSGQLRDACSEPIKEYLRHIDTVTVKGSKQPMKMYTVDLDPQRLSPGKGKPPSKSMNAKAAKALWKSIEEGEVTTESLFANSREISKMREGLSSELQAKWAEGLEAYIKGDWSRAEVEFRSCLELKPGDGPSMCLLQVIAESGGESPQDWNGVRNLLEK